MPLRSVKMNRFILGFQRRVWCPKWVPLSSSCFMVTTAIVGHSFVSVVDRRRVKPGPGGCCDAGPVVDGTARHAVRTPGGTGETRCRRAKSARRYGLREGVYTVRPGALSTAPASRVAD